ncbi:MAG: AAA family ATPase [Phycisphaerae bacterium]
MSKRTPDETIQSWIERDLGAALDADELPPAFEVDDLLQQMSALLTARRCPVLTGEPGVGKSAVITEFIRRARREPSNAFADRQMIQISLTRNASAAREGEFGAEFKRFVEAVTAARGRYGLYIRDLHAAYRFDVEPQLQALAYGFDGPILAEAEERMLRSLFEYAPQLEQHYVALTVEEPSPERMQRLLAAWRDESHRRARRYHDDALDLAYTLTSRFLGRTRMPRAAIDFLDQLGSLQPPDCEVGPEQVIARFGATFRVPRALIDPRTSLDLEALESRFAHEVLGQTEAVRAMVRLIGMVKAGLSDARRPFGVFLFVGPTGVGKTHVAQLLAEYLFGSRERLLRVNMADYPEEHGAAALFGASCGNLTDRRGTLTSRVMGAPFAVILLDEFEKAHPKVHDRFLQMMDEGCFINGAGETIGVRSTIIIATSNAGAEIYRGETFGFRNVSDLAARDRELDRALQRHFRFEFLNRFDQVVHFHPLSREHMRAVALRELELLKRRSGIRQRGLRLEIDESVVDWLAVHGYDADYGARFLKRTVERDVTTALADAIVRQQPPAGATIELTVRAHKVTARWAEPAAPRRADVTLPIGTVQSVRTLDAESLGAEADRLLAGAQGRLAALDQRRREYSALVEQMNDPAFWSRSDERVPVLERFRELDVAIQTEERLAEPLRRLADLCASAPERRRDVERLARVVEAAAAAYHDWTRRIAEEGPSAVWLVISNVDPLAPASAWLEELVEMELAWSRRVHLAASVAAYELRDNELARAVLVVEGLGALAYLTMEAGVHRQCRHPMDDARALVEIVARQPHTACGGAAVARLARPRRGRFDLTPAFRARVEVPSRGVICEWLGVSAAGLEHAVADITRAWAARPAEPARVARVYNEHGGGARDPRTGVSMPHLRDVLRGGLDKFLEGFRRMSPSPENSIGAPVAARGEAR